VSTFSVLRTWVLITSADQRKLGVRPEGVDVAHTSDSQRREIIETVNKTWDEGIEQGMQRIPNIVAVRKPSWNSRCI